MNTPGVGKDKIHLGGTARSPDDVVALHELGLEFAEVPITNPDRFLSVIREYALLKERLGLYYLCHGPREGDPNNTGTLERVYFPKVEKILSIMPQLGMRTLTIHLWMDNRFVGKESIRYKIDLIGRLLKKALKCGVTLCIENLSENFVDLAGPFEALPGLNLTLDLGHAQLLGPVNTSYGFIEKYPGRIKHIHLHDNIGGNSQDDDLHLPVGKGRIDFRRIIPGLREIGYRRTVTLELRPREIERCIGYVKRLFREAGYVTGME